VKAGWRRVTFALGGGGLALIEAARHARVRIERSATPD
jgi:hypothetical protein